MLWFESEILHKDQCVKSIVHSPRCCWDMVELLRGWAHWITKITVDVHHWEDIKTFFPIASRPLWDGQVSSTSHDHHSRLRHNRPKQEDQVAMNRNHNQTKHLFILGYLVQAFCWSNGILTRWEVQGSTSFCLMFPKVLNSVFWIAPWTLYLHEGRSAVLIKEGQFIPEGGICIL